MTDNNEERASQEFSFYRELVERFPALFRNLPWGIECGAGWWDLIENLCEEIDSICQDKGYDFYITDIKEKFGGLRFCLNQVTDEIEDIIQFYEEKSFEVCEECGSPGEIYDDFWVVTRCQACKDKEK